MSITDREGRRLWYGVYGIGQSEAQKWDWVPFWSVFSTINVGPTSRVLNVNCIATGGVLPEHCVLCNWHAAIQLSWAWI